ncbi:glycoside hydrolase 5 family protein [Thermostilla marina]
MKRLPGLRMGIVASMLCLSFWPHAPTKAAELSLEVPVDSIAAYEPVQIRIGGIPTTRYANPFDPGEVQVDLEVQSPDGTTRQVPCFWMQPFTYRVMKQGARSSDWLYPVEAPGWYARFAAEKPGTYRLRARLHDAEGERFSPPAEVVCTPSESRGFLRIDSRRPAHFAFDDGTPFFGVGQNLAFIGHSQYVTLGNLDSILARLRANGANFLRVWAGCEDWAMCIEGRKNAWARTWEGKNPYVDLPPEVEDPPLGEGAFLPRRVVELSAAGRKLDPPHGIAVMPNKQYTCSLLVWMEAAGSIRMTTGNTEYRLAETDLPVKQWVRRDWVIETDNDQWWLRSPTLFAESAGRVFLADISLRETHSAVELLHGVRPEPRRGRYHQRDCALLDRLIDSARRHDQYLQLCLLTRDLYMADLSDPDSETYRRAVEDAKAFMRHAVARWGAYCHVAVWEYFNEMNPNLPTDSFYAELGRYLDEIDPYRHLRTTSAWGPAPKDYRHRSLDIAEEHRYLRPQETERGFDEVSLIIDRVQSVRDEASGKPVLLAEFGLADARWGESPAMAEDSSLRHFHNALWASAMSGAAGTAMFWWWERLDRMDAYSHYRPLAEFVHRAGPITEDARFVLTPFEAPDGRALILYGKRSCRFWLVRNDATWLSRSRGGRPAAPAAVQLRLPSLLPGKYRVTWWNTHEGVPIGVSDFTITSQATVLSTPVFGEDLAGFVHAL